MTGQEHVNDLRRICAVAVVLLVLLRIAIGWQLLYEGLWKLDTLDGPRPWTAAGYLKNAEGPLRTHFRAMAGDGDPDELGWLDYDTVAGCWDAWHAKFVDHYGLDEKQQDALSRLLNGSKQYTETLAELPDGLTLSDAGVDPAVIRYDARAERLIVSGEMHLTPDEKRRLENLVANRDDDAAKAWLRAVRRVYVRSARGMGYREKLAGLLRGDPNLIGNNDWQRLGQLDQYKQMLAEYEADRAQAAQTFEWDHLRQTLTKIQAKRAELTGPVKSLEAELRKKAQALLSIGQLSRGPVPEPWTSLRTVETLTIAGLTVLGALLIFGLGTRVAALIGAFMLFNFYLAIPPWPGVPETPGPEHSFIIDKNLIEVIALLGIAALPTGSWFGVDGLISRWFARRRASRPAPKTAANVARDGDAGPGEETGCEAVSRSSRVEDRRSQPGPI